MSLENPNYVANGTIFTCRFVKVSATTDHAVEQASFGVQTIGISQVGTKGTPGVSGSMVAADAGDMLHVFGPGAVCNLQLVGACNAGDLLEAGSTGRGTPVVTGKVGAMALQSGVSGDRIRVLVVQIG